ncbi:MAG: hypothetical protein DRQ55_00360 [Planctomycetota bacterium]|nr:MAG: hypothetical protein DRQ55_00360 [Planctomycetota bacterium]
MSLSFLLAALLLLTAPLQGREPDSGDASARAATRAFSDALARGLDATTLLTLRDLAAHDHPTSVDMLLDVLADASPSLRPSARRVLAAYQRPDSLERIQRQGLDHRDGEVRAQVLMALAAGRPPGVDWVGACYLALDDEYPEVRAVAISALGRAREQGALKHVIESVGDEAERVRAASAGALVRLAQRRALPLLDQLAEDSAWRVRLAVVRALRELKTRGGVELLVDMLAREPGRLREDVILSLVRLTGRNYGNHAKAWSAFLAQAPDDYLAEGDARAMAPVAGSTQTVAKYYGLSSQSTRFAVVTDLSTSMDHVDEGRYKDSARRSRLEVTQTELGKLLGGLDASVSVNLLTFSDGVEAWSSTLVPLDKRQRERALREVQGYRTRGGTNVFAALERVFDLAEASIDTPGQADAAPDTIFLLTDGAPSVGPMRDVELLLEYAAERNRRAALRFHCVILTKDRLAVSFLGQLAQASGGESVAVLK